MATAVPAAPKDTPRPFVNLRRFDVGAIPIRDTVVLDTIRKLNAATEAIGSKHASLGGDAGFLGPKVGEVVGITGGYFQAFKGGVIYFSTSTSAKEVHGGILEKWGFLGREKSILGFPTTDETSTPDGIGRYNFFQRGVIYWTPGTGAHEVHGDILHLWASMGYEKSYLGYPTSDEEDVGIVGGRTSRFEAGQIAWTAQRGAQVVRTSYVPRSSGGGLRPQSGTQSPTGLNPIVGRRVTLSASLFVLDDDASWIGESNDVGRFQDNAEVYLSSTQISDLLDMEGRVDNEVRVELHLNVTALLSGDIKVTGKFLLYEGASDSTTDLDGSLDIEDVLPADQPAIRKHRVNNTDEGGDYAEIVLSYYNYPV